MRGLVDAPETIRIIITVSLLVAILGVAQWIWPPQEVYRIPLLFRDQRLSIFDVNVTYHDLFTFGVAIVVAILLRLLLFRTQIGLDMRASVDSRPLAMLHGARPHRSAATAWAIGCGLAAVAGVLVGPLNGQLNHTNLTLLIINAYAAALIGRLRSLPLTFVGRRVPRPRRLLRHRVLPRGQRLPHHLPVRDPGGRALRRAAGAAEPAAAHALGGDVAGGHPVHQPAHRGGDRRR